MSDAESETEYQATVDKFADWCSEHHLQLNVQKTKELVVDPRRGAPPVQPVTIGQDQVEIVESFRYLGVVLDSALNFKEQVTSVQKKCQQRLYVLRRLRSFELDPQLLLNLYRSIIEPLLTYCGSIYHPSLCVTEKNKLVQISKTASKIIGRPVPSLSEITDKALLRKAHSVSADSSHPLHSEFELLPSGRRYRSIRCKKAKYSRSFVPAAVNRLNAASGLCERSRR